MLRAGRFATFAILPLFTLFLGWQLGMRFEQRTQERVEQAQEESLSGSGVTISDPEQEVDMTLFWQVWRLLLAHYIDTDMLDTRELLFGAIRGMTEGVGDPYTVFMTPQENEDFRDSLSGSLEGIGAQLEFLDGEIIVVAPVKGSPAERAGLLPRDIIIGVDDTDVMGMALQEVITLIRGPKGTTVRLAIMRNDAPVSFSIIRDQIHVPSVEGEMLTEGNVKIAHVTINQFGTETVEEVRDAIMELLKQKPQSLILDLRFNGGGYLEGAVDIVSFFLKQGKVVTVSGRGDAPQHHYVTGKTLETDLPMVVLINQGSASASEITAGALQDPGRATIIGMQSFGKGTVQEIIDLPMKTSLRVTTAKWLTPNGTDIGKHGITPDIVVDRTEEDFTEKRDPQLDAAVEFLMTGKVVNVKTGTGATR